MPFSPLTISYSAVDSGVLGEGSQINITCVQKVEHLPTPFSSTCALTLLGIVIVAIVVLSLATHHCHKGKMKRRKMEREQEEYERDHRSPVPARAKPDPGRCTITRPASTDPKHRASSSDHQTATSPDHPSSTLRTAADNMKGVEEEVLEAVAVS